MKKQLLLTLILAFIGLSTYAQNNWAGMISFPGTPRSGAVAFTIGSKTYFGSGSDDDGDDLNDFWEYDPNVGGGTWTQKTSFPGESRHNAVAFSIGNKGYFGTGIRTFGGTLLRDFWEFDPTGNGGNGSWTQKADLLGVARSSAIGFSIGTKGYIGTGYIGDCYNCIPSSQDFYEYNPATNLWTQKANFGGGDRMGAVGFTICEIGYVGTGYYTDYIYRKDFWKYNQGTDTWTQMTDFGGTERSNAVGFSICTLGYVGTGGSLGYGGTGGTNDFWEYNPDGGPGGTWTLKANFPSTARLFAVGFSIDGKGYVGSGSNGTGSTGHTQTDFLKYTPSNTFTPQQPGAISPTASVCPGSTHTYSINAVSCATSYTWTVPAGATFTGSGTSINVTFATTAGDIAVTANNACGASTASTLAIALHTPPATPTINTGGDPTTFCAPGSVQLISSIASFFSWNTNPIQTSQSITVSSSGTYTVTVTDLNGCSTSSVPVPVTVNPLPTPTITPSGPTTFCEGGNVILTSNYGSGNEWSPNGETAQLISADASGDYSTTVTDGNGCMGTATQVVTEYILPIPEISESNGALTCDNSGYSYQWYLNSGSTPIATGQTYSPTVNGNYTVVIADGNGCSSSSPSYPYIGVGMANEALPSFSVQPNPATTHLFIATAEAVPQTIAIYTVSGQKLNEQPFAPQVDISTLPAGIYFIEVRSEYAVGRKRFVKM